MVKLVHLCWLAWLPQWAEIADSVSGKARLYASITGIPSCWKAMSLLWKEEAFSWCTYFEWELSV